MIHAARLVALLALAAGAAGCVDLEEFTGAMDIAPDPVTDTTPGLSDSGGDAGDASSADGAIPRSDGARSDTSAPDATPDTPIAPDGDAGCPEEAACTLDTPRACYEGRCNVLGDCVPVPVPGCCLDDEDCAGVTPPDACRRMRCIGGTCAPIAVPGCCVDPADCDDGEACTLDSCTGAGGRCVHCPQGCACPVSLEPFHEDFSAEILDSGDFLNVDYQISDDVRWRASERRWVSPPRSAWLGNASCTTYYSGPLDEDCQPSGSLGEGSGPVHVALRSRVISLPALAGGNVVMFWIWADVEPLSTGAGDERDVLRLDVEEVSGGETWTLTSSLAVGKDTLGRWRLMSADLSPWTGEAVRLRLAFDTRDGVDNHHEGVYVDDVRVVPRCIAGCCTEDSDCADLAAGDPCLEPRCVELGDGAGNVCAALPRSPGERCEACEGGDACDDDNPCTSDVCGEDGTCTHTLFCCFEDTVLADGFESGLGDWFVADDQPEDGVSWAATDAAAVEGSFSARLGNSEIGTYATGGPVRASLTSEIVTLPTVAGDPGAETLLGLSFWLRLSTEWDGEIYDNPAGIDRLSLEILHDGDATEVWSSDDVEGSTDGLWLPVTVDLGAWAGEPVQLRWTFDTLDGNANDFAGPALDDVRVGILCGAGG